ncbi:hypothetical protein [Lysinibacillus sp. RC79]|uniref:hypothetical protein n=1 Tax=Lysinibacillus sp. RC79 TaxID=3156296 RepID=UPI0035174DEF
MYKPSQLNDDYVLKKVDAGKFEEASIEFWKNFLQNYRNYVEENYLVWYKEYPDPFIFMKPTHWVTIFYNHHIDFHIFKNPSDGMTFCYQQFTTLGEMRAHDRLTEEQKREKLQRILGKFEVPLTVIQIKYGFILPAIIPDSNHVSEDPDDLPEMGLIKGRNYAQLHGDTLIKEKKERFNIFGLDEIVHKINSPSFEYELGESIKAYKLGLYLAAASTAGIALENILRILIANKIGENAIPDKSYIWKSINELDKKKILPGRLRAEILSQSEIRNSNAHTNDDPVRKDTVETLYRIVREIILLL